MNRKLSIGLTISVLVMATLACGINDIMGSTQPPDATIDIQAAVALSIQQTAAIQTAVAQSVAGTLNPNIQNTLAPIVITATQGTTALPGIDPTDMASATPEKILVTVSQATHCRSGPGANYDWLGSLPVGQEAEVFGKDPWNTSWYIRNPSNPSGFCWIYGAFATVKGDTSNLMVMTAMPTPTKAVTATPSFDFSITFSATEVCAGPQYFVEYLITNTGGITIESYRLTVSGIGDWVDNQFTEYTGCTAGTSQNDLTPGESGYVSSKFIAPNNVTRNVTIYACSEDNLAGTCKSKTISYTP